MEPDLLETLIKRYEAGERDPELVCATAAPSTGRDQ